MTILNTGMQFDSICPKTQTSLLILSTDSIFICTGGWGGWSYIAYPYLKYESQQKLGDTMSRTKGQKP